MVVIANKGTQIYIIINHSSFTKLPFFWKNCTIKTEELDLNFEINKEGHKKPKNTKINS